MVAERVEHRLAVPKARASTDAAREREAGPAAQHDVEALVRRFGVLADRCPAQPRTRLRSALRTKACLGGIVQCRQYDALLMLGYDSRGSVELPAVWPNARLAAKLFGGCWRSLAGHDAPPIWLEAEVLDRDRLRCLASLSDAMHLRLRVLELRQDALA